MTHQPPPNWQPLTQLPLIAAVIDDMLASAEEQEQTLQQARPKSHVLDDATVGRVIAVYTTQRDDLWLFAEQLRRWEDELLTPAQRHEVQRLMDQVARLRTVLDAILTLSAELKAGTIEQVLAKSDLQLGLEALHRPPDQDR